VGFRFDGNPETIPVQRSPRLTPQARAGHAAAGPEEPVRDRLFVHARYGA
jgi:hypothetical protein